MNTPCEEEDQDAMKLQEIIFIYTYISLVQKYDVINTIIVFLWFYFYVESSLLLGIPTSYLTWYRIRQQASKVQFEI